MKGKLFILLFIFCFTLTNRAQKKSGTDYYLISLDESKLNSFDKFLLDSLLPLYHKAKNDTLKFKVLKNLSDNLSDDKIWTQYNKLMYNRFKNSNDTLSVLACAYAKNNFGYYHQYYYNNLDSALIYYQSALDAAKSINDETVSGIAINNLAYIYQHRGQLEKSIELYNEAHNLFLKNKDSSGLVSIHVNLGDVYYKAEEFDKAEDSFKKALQYSKKNTVNNYIGNVYGQLSSIYFQKKKYKLADHFLNKAIEIYKTESNFNRLGIMYVNGLSQSMLLGDKEKSKTYCELSLSKVDSVTDLSVKSRIYDYASGYFSSIANNKVAKTFADSAYFIAKKLGYPQLIYSAASKLSLLYEHEGNLLMAFRMLRESMQMNDSINNDAIKKAVLKQQFKSDYEKKEIELEANQMKKDAERKAEQKKQAFYMYGILVFASSLFIVLIIIYRSYKAKKKSALDLTEKNSIINSQKKLVEEKQKEIIDSITYAQKIQAAVLTGEDVWNKVSPEHFIIFQPKDIVSGDFYWAFNTVNNRSVFVLADCTGHGVPGGFMSMLGNSFLNELVVENKIFKPDEILNKLRQKIISSLGQKGARDRRDGMDMAICTWNKLNDTLEFAGANNKLWLVRNGVLQEFEGDKMPVGNYEGELKPFSCYNIQLQKNDLIILCTDGFYDQFGGEKNKKMMSKNLKNIISKNSALPLHQQKSELELAFSKWKGENEQVDDVSLIAIRVV